MKLKDALWYHKDPEHLHEPTIAVHTWQGKQFGSRIRLELAKKLVADNVCYTSGNDTIIYYEREFNNK